MNIEPFAAWSESWLELAGYPGEFVPEPGSRIERVVALWQRPVPPTPEWRRLSLDARLFPDHSAHGRNHEHQPRDNGEHALELDLLLGRPDPTLIGATFVDGVSAVPLTRDVGGGREGNVEADMLLLVRDDRGYRLQVVEVKTHSNSAWYAVVENLRQLRLFREGIAVQGLFHKRLSELPAKFPAKLPLEGVVLAPRTFYEDAGKKQSAVEPAKALCARMRAEGIEVRLAIWDPETRTARQH